MAQNIPITVADFETQVSTAIAAAGTSFSISSATDDDGTALPAGKYCFTIDNGKSNKEYLMGQLNGTDITSVVRVSRQGVESSGAEYAHRVGAPVIITDMATIQRVGDVLRGADTLDGSNPIVYDAEPTLTDRKEVATVAYVLDTVTGGTVAFDSQTIAGNAGEAVAAGDLVYFKTSDQEWYLTDANTAATVRGVQLGIALGTGSDGVSVTDGIQISGTYTTTGLTAGDTYYASNTAGEYTNSAGDHKQVIGVALSTTKLLMVPVNQEKENLGVPIGTVIPFAGSTAPTNYLLCYGQAISRTTYAGLFAIISDDYGIGDGSTTFNVPDLRGRVVAALDNLGGVSADVVTDTDADTLGGTDGEEDHVLTEAELASHAHDFVGNGTVHYSGGDRNSKSSSASETQHEATGTADAGSDTAHNTMQPTVFMSYIIKAL